MKDNRSMAFWGHDKYPYFLSGIVTRTESGRAETVEYGENNWFHYDKLLPIGEGIALKMKMEDLAARRQRLMETVSRDYDSLLKSSIGTMLPLPERLEKV